MASPADLEVNLLEFRQKSFQFARLVRVGTEEFALFSRTETESENRFRPKLVQLFLALPRRSIRYDREEETLRWGDPEPRRPTAAEPVGSERGEFRENGIDFRRLSLGGGRWLYVPAESAETLARPDALAALGLAPTGTR